jgi:hypothetical protein
VDQEIKTARQSAQQNAQQYEEAIEKYLGVYLLEYQLFGEPPYIPTEREQLLIEDAIRGLLADEQFIDLILKRRQNRRFAASLLKLEP